MAATIEKTETGIAIVDGESRIEVGREEIGSLLAQASAHSDTLGAAKQNLVNALTEEKQDDVKIQKAFQRFQRADHMSKLELRRKLKEIEDRARAEARALAGSIMEEAKAVVGNDKASQDAAELAKLENQAP